MSIIQQAHEAVDLPEVQAMIKELGKFGLGVFVPHLHTEKGFEELPIDTVQLESSLQRVGWVERSETHQFLARKKLMGFARALPILRALRPKERPLKSVP